jgi:hypothetical protein
MSTILNTLKKLEEEKSVLEKNVDLKGLLLQGQETIYPQVEDAQSQKWRMVGGLIVICVLLGGVMVYLNDSSTISLPEPKPVFTPKPVSPPPKTNKPTTPAKTSPGFPLAGIQDIEPSTMTDSGTDPMYDDDFFEPEDTLVLPVETSPPVMDEALPEGAEEIREIESLIQSAITIGEADTGNLEEISEFTPNNSPDIPGLTVKGIIFLNSDNPVNHIFVSTPSEKNRKLKVGETLLSATLEGIEAQKAVFSYQGQRVEKATGE